jgi:branched-chain amino acid transport system substrate-binding protein
MGEVILASEVGIEASRRSVFSLFGTRPDAGWLFGAEVSDMRPGSVVRLALPVGPDARSVEGTARIVEVTPWSRIVLRHEAPWAGTITITLRENAGVTSVRVVATMDERSVQWMGRQRGLELEADVPVPGAIRLGLLAPMSGPNGVFGRAVDNCARLAVREINDNGGLLGRPVHLIVADDATEPAAARREVERMIRRDGIHALVGSHDSRTYRAARAAVRTVGIPYIYGSVNEGGSDPGPLFRLGEVPEDQLTLSIPALMRHTQSGDWYIVGSDYSWPRRIGTCARTVVGRSGGRVRGERYIPLGQRNFDDLLEHIDRSGAVNIMSAMVGRDAVAFERAFHAAGLRSRTRTLGALVEESTLEHIGDEAARGIWSVFGYFKDLSTPENKRFVDAYRREYGPWAPPPSTISECAYEAIQLYASAVIRARSIESADVVRELPAASVRGPRGHLGLNTQRRLHQVMYLAEAVPGGFQVVEALGRVGTAA